MESRDSFLYSKGLIHECRRIWHREGARKGMDRPPFIISKELAGWTLFWAHLALQIQRFEFCLLICAPKPCAGPGAA